MRFLEAPEILLCICEHVFITTSGRSDLAALAETCRAFYKPAIKVLWRAQTSLMPLVCCFPCSILDVVRDDHGKLLTVKFRRTPSSTDWERPLIYAKLISTIGFDRIHMKPPLMLHPDVIHMLFDSCPSLPLLPKLQVLDHSWITLNPRPEARKTKTQVALEMACLDKLSSPTELWSISLNLRVCRTIHDRHALLQLLTQSHPSVKSLQIHNANDDMDVFEYLAPLGSLQKLKSLELLDFRPCYLWDFDEIPDTSTWFPDLHKLTIRGFISLAELLLETLPLPRLQKLCVQVGFKENPDSICTLILSNPTWQESLRSIEIVGSDLSPRVLPSLFAFKHLRSLVLFPTHLDDDMLERVSKAWPMLECFSLEDKEFGPLPSRDLEPPTLRSLVSLAKHCPHLRRLGLQLDASRIPQHADDVELSPKRNRKSFLLVVRSFSDICDSTGVAEFLLDLFPFIVIAFSPNVMHIEEPRMDRWRTVAQIVRQGRTGLSTRALDIGCPSAPNRPGTN